MSTAEEGGAKPTTTANPSSSYGGGGGGGVGGKFRRKPFRKPATPYDRPLIANRSNSSWLQKLVVEPASKLISYGARRFFDPLLRKRIPPPPPPPQLSEPNNIPSDGIPEAVPSDPTRGECSLPIISGGNSISDVEQLLKQKTFTRSEIDRLSELLHSRAGEVSLRDDGKRSEENVSDFRKHQQIERGPTEENRNKGSTSYGVVSTPISNSKVIGDSIASPTELAKSYMGSRPSKLPPAALVNHSQVTMEGNKLLSNMRSASKSVDTPLKMNTVVGSGSPENGYTTKPISFRRSAIYNMSRAPYSKRTSINHNGYAGLPVPSTSLALLENSELSASKSTTLKRRSFVLDDVGSVGPIRRIRQKSNLAATGTPHSDRMGSNSDAIRASSKGKLPLIDRTEENTNTSISSTSYAIVPFESNDKNALNDNSSESMMVAGWKTSPFKLTPNMLRGQALRSMENATSSELLRNVEDDHKFESSDGLLDARDFPPQGNGKVDENGLLETSADPDTDCRIINNNNNDPAVFIEASSVRDETLDDVETAPSQPKKKAAFRMSALEDFVDLDDDLTSNGVASHPFSEATRFTDRKFEEAKVLEFPSKPEVKSPLELMSSKKDEVSSSIAVAASLPEVKSPSEEVTAAPPTIPLSVDKPKEINNRPSVTFSSSVADKFLPESGKTPENSSSLLNDASPTSSLLKVVEPTKPLAAEDTSGKFDTAASNGPVFPGIQISIAAPVIFTPSVSVSDSIQTNTGSITSSGKVSKEPSFGFGASPNPFTKTSAIIPAGDSNNKESSGIPSSSTAPGLGSSTSNPSANNSVGSLFGSAINTFGTVSQTTPAQSLSFASDMNRSSSFVSSQVSTPTISFGFNSSSSTSDTGSVKASASSLFGATPSNGSSSSFTTPSIFSFGVNSSSSSSTNAIGSTTAASSPSFGFGVSSTSSSTNAIGSTAAPSLPSFGFGVSSSSSSTNAIGSTSTASVPSFGFGASSTSSSTNAIGSTTTASIPSFGFGASSTSSTNAIESTVAPSIPSFGFGASSVSSSMNAIGSTVAPSIPSFGFGASSTSSSTNLIGSTAAATTPSFSFGVNSSNSAPITATSSSTSAIGSNSGAAPSVFSFGLSSSTPASVSNAATSFSNGVFSSAPVNSNNGTSNAFGSSLQAPSSTIFGSSPFSFGASPQTNAATPSSSSVFSFGSAPAQPVFGNPATGFATSTPANNYSMNNGEDSMAEDPMQSNSPPSAPVFGQPNISPNSGFMFGSSAPSQPNPNPNPNPFQFGGQQNQGVAQTPPMFQASSSVDFNAGGSFSLGSGGGDKSGRKFVKASRSKNRKK